MDFELVQSVMRAASMESINAALHVKINDLEQSVARLTQMLTSMSAISDYQCDQPVEHYGGCRRHNHPLTCGNYSGHHNLYPAIRDQNVVLICPDCDYLQTYIPDLLK